MKYIPTPDELGCTTDRKLLILTWGRALLKGTPQQSERNFNAGVLNGRGGSINLRKLNGLSDEIQGRISRCSLFPTWIKMVIDKIEDDDLMCISINCTKGRHRSVAAAEILKKVYYPAAQIDHLTIR